MHALVKRGDVEEVVLEGGDLHVEGRKDGRGHTAAALEKLRAVVAARVGARVGGGGRVLAAAAAAGAMGRSVAGLRVLGEVGLGWSWDAIGGDERADE